MKKRIKKVILLLFYILISFFVTKIKGAEIPFGSNIGGHVVGEYIPCDDRSPFCFNYVPIVGSGSSGYVQGIRVTIVNQDGAKISGTHSHDFFLDKQRSYDFLNKKGISFYSTKRHKNDIVNPGSPNIPWTSSVDLNYKSAGNYTILTNDPFPEYMGIVVANNRVLLKEYFLDRGQKKLWDFLVPTYLEPLGYDLQADIEANKTDPNFYKKRAILIEPLVWMRLTMSTGRPQQYAVDFAGTVTEVAKMISQTKEPTYSGSETFWDLFRLYDDYGNLAHYDNIHFRCETPFYRTYPLSIYCDSNEWLGGLQGVQNWVNGSYPGVYVYNDKNGVPREIPNFANEILTRNCVGAGHVWFNEIISLDCEDLEFAKNNVPLCCKELYEIHHANRDINIKNYLSPTGISCCDSLKDIIPNRLYDDNCIIETRDCDYKLDVLCPEDCFSNTEGYVKDIGENGNENEWKCIFDSKSSSYSEVKRHYQWTDDGLLNNPYCEVYCREEITYKLPGHGFTVKAGHHFTVGFLSEEQSINSWGPIEFSGFQECRTKGNGNNMTINYAKFVREYEEADRKTVREWDKWQEAIAWNGSVDEADSSDTTCSYECGTDEEPETCSCNATLYTPSEYCFGGEDDKNYCATATSWKDGSCCDDSSPEKDEDEYEDEYIKAYNDRTQLLKKIEKCSNWNRGYSTFKPEVQLQYEEDKYGFSFGTIRDGIELSKLKANLVENKQQFLFYEGSTYEKRLSYSRSQEELITTHICEKANGDYNTGEFCEDQPKLYPINDNREEKYNKKYSYSLNNNVYIYITKPRGVSQHRRPVSSSDQYINIGYSNLPIHYSRLPLKYDIDLKYTSFGPNNKFNNYVFRGNKFGRYRSNSFKCNNLYECEYEVDNEFMYCSRTKCKDIQIIFRPVSLSHPFLTSTGANRRPGENWHNDVEKITENRNLSVPERIYSDRDPMYEITLNTALIGQIRKYNRDARGGYSDFSLECLTGTGRECKSQFIRSKFNSSFVSRWCGMSSDWDRCEKDDR